jgi:hypothetical protein
MFGPKRLLGKPTCAWVLMVCEVATHADRTETTYT